MCYIVEITFAEILQSFFVFFKAAQEILSQLFGCYVFLQYYQILNG